MGDIHFRNWEEPEAPQWKEDEAIAAPAFPKDEDLIEFYVSETTSHRFFIDVSTLDVGHDGVVRYVLVVRTGGGATNTSFEGIRCETREYKIYASGRHDGTWTIAPNSRWHAIENKPVNRYHATLSRYFFCPNGVAIVEVAEGKNALRLGRHPEAR